MRFLKFQDYLTEAQLNEIGEGVVPFSYRRVGPGKISSWMSEMAMYDKASSIKWYNFEIPLTYQFTSEKANYLVKVIGEFKYHQYINFGTRKPGAPKPQEYDVIIAVAFDTLDSDKEAITNFGEQFRVVSTVTEVLKEVINEIQEIQWVKLQEIHIAPKLEDADTGKPVAQTKRGRLYLEYIKKQGNFLKGNWTAEIKKDRFVIKNGKWSGGEPGQFIHL
jgi:hypothetical protein